MAYREGFQWRRLLCFFGIHGSKIFNTNGYTLREWWECEYCGRELDKEVK